MLLTHEQKSFARAYDHILQCAETALADPGIAATLGETAISMRVLLQDTFLPNIRHGELSLPDSERGNARIAVIPDRKNARTNALYDGYPLRWPAYHAYSDFYDVDCTEEVRNILTSHRSEQHNNHNSRLSLSGTVAQTRSNHTLSVDGVYTLRSRPVITTTKASRDRATAANLLHELVHAEDVLRDGSLMFGTTLYRATTESRAYYVDSVIDPFNITARVIERNRRRTADHGRPFAPSPQRIKYLKRLRAV